MIYVIMDTAFWKIRSINHSIQRSPTTARNSLFRISSVYSFCFCQVFYTSIKFAAKLKLPSLHIFRHFETNDRNLEKNNILSLHFTLVSLLHKFYAITVEPYSGRKRFIERISTNNSTEFTRITRLVYQIFSGTNGLHFGYFRQVIPTYWIGYCFLGNVIRTCPRTAQTTCIYTAIIF